MGKKCSVIGCRSGYKSCKKKNPILTLKTVKLYTFPRDPEERRVWLRVLPNKVCPYKAQKENISVCSLHFPENVRFNDKEGKHRHPIDPPSVFNIKKGGKGVPKKGGKEK